MEHKVIWHALELLASQRGLSCSGLARVSGLDSTTFNKSKQFSADGTPRWPSCSTISKVLKATNFSPAEFAHLCDIANCELARIP